MNNFTPRARQILVLARKEAERFNHNYIGTEHILLGIIKLGHGVAVSVFEHLSIHLDMLRQELESEVGPATESPHMPANIPYTPRVKKVLTLANREASDFNHSYIGTEHIFLGLLREGEGVAARVLQGMGVDIAEARELILREIDPNYESGGEGDFSEVFAGTEDGDSGSQGKSKTPALKAFGTDLSKEAREGRLDPIIGRHDEIERVIQILCRRTKKDRKSVV